MGTVPGASRSVCSTNGVSDCPDLSRPYIVLCQPPSVACCFHKAATALWIASSRDRGPFEQPIDNDRPPDANKNALRVISVSVDRLPFRQDGENGGAGHRHST